MTGEGALSPKRETFSPTATQRRWHVAHNGERRGPLSDAELVLLAGDGAIAPDDLVWRPGYLGWTLAGRITGLLIPPDLPESAARTPSEPPSQPPPPGRSAAEPPPPPPRSPMPEPARVARTTEPPAPAIAAPAAALPLPAPPAGDEGLRALLMAMGTPSQPQASWLHRHWRGELSLRQSFWINGILVTGPIIALCAWLIFAVSDGAHLPSWLGFLGAGAPAWASGLPHWALPLAVRLLLIPAVALQVWCIVGVFRSAWRREGLWGEIATATAVCSALCCTVFTLLMLRG